MMGITHLAGVGRSPGAVTSPLAYLRENQALIQEDHSFGGSILQDLVIFYSQNDPETDEYIWNQYGSAHPRPGWVQVRRHEKLKDILIDFFLNKENSLIESGGNLYLWPVDVEDYDCCFESIAIATLALGRPDSTGRHIWANLTGGTNILNAALLEISFLSGLIGRLYYAFLSDDAQRRYLLPANKQFTVDWIWPPKTTYDNHYYDILRILSTVDDWCEDVNLLDFLKQDEANLPSENHYFAHVSLQRLRDQYLNRMDGFEVERRDHGTEVRISPRGQEILKRIQEPLFQALVKRGQDVDSNLVQEWRDTLKRYKID